MTGFVKPWSGGECPEADLAQIKPLYRGPASPPPAIRITCAPARRLDWSHDGGPDDIVGYVVLFDPRAPHPPAGGGRG